MPRIREFNPDQALSSAMELFWERGYDATSMADLVTHLGVSRAGIYSAFGGKRELFLKSVALYSRDRDPVLVRSLARPGSALGNVRELVHAYGDEILGDERHRGCLVVNSAVELAGRDEGVARLVEDSWEVLETALTSALTQALEDGELAADKNPQALARFLTTFLQGLQVLGRTGPRTVLVRDAIAQALTVLG